MKVYLVIRWIISVFNKSWELCFFVTKVCRKLKVYRSLKKLFNSPVSYPVISFRYAEMHLGMDACFLFLFTKQEDLRVVN